MNKLEQLINAAIEDAQAVCIITRADGSTLTTTNGHGSAKEGRFEIYVVPVQTRGTASYQRHHRVTYYLDNKRTTRAIFEAAILCAHQNN